MIQNRQNEEDSLTIEQALIETNRLAAEMNSNPKCPFEIYQKYIEIYVKMQSRSEEFFPALCEHEVIQKMFGIVSESQKGTKVLQLFNLLLANTTDVNSLIYLFSQPAVHSFLFEKFSLDKQHSDSVQYYVQLLKAIIMKMINGHSSLIKLFCNNRYSSFPLLCQITFLGAHSQQQLVKITAQQCVLLLINLLTLKKTGTGYLAELQMAVYFHELTLGICQRDSDKQGCLKYIIDLLVALKNNSISLHMLLNAFTTNVIISHIYKFNYILQIMSDFFRFLRQNQELPEEIKQQIILIFTRILCHICFSRFFNSTYFILITKLSQVENKQGTRSNKTLHTQMLKYYHQRFKKILPYLEEYDKRPQIQPNLTVLLEGWITFNSSNQVNKIKQNSFKSKGGLFSFFASKPDPLEVYLKNVTTSIGINYNSLRFPMFKISATIDFSVSLYFVESVLSKQQLKIGGMGIGGYQQYQVHFNDNRGRFELNQAFCLQILEYLDYLAQRNVYLNTNLQEKLLKQVKWEYNFLIKLRQYLGSSLCDYLLLVQNEYSNNEISLMSKIFKDIKLYNFLQKKTVQKLLWKCQQIQTQINDIAFKNDFKSLIRYVLNNFYQNTLLGKNRNSTDSHAKQKILKKMLKYEFIKSIIDPMYISLREFVLSKWAQYTSIKQNEIKLTINFCIEKKANIHIRTSQTIAFKVQIITPEDLIIQFQLQEEGIFQGMFNELSIYFSEYPPGIHFNNKEEQQLFREEWNKICSLRQQVITKLILQYFQNTHNHLCKLLFQKKHQIKDKSSKSEILHKSLSI